MQQLVLRWRIVAFCVLIVSLATGAGIAVLHHTQAKADATLNPEYSWVGNSAGTPSDYIQMSTATIGVQPGTGNFFGAIDWDEGGKEVGMYDTNGNSIANVQALQGGTGIAVTANSNYVYYAVRDNNSNQVRRADNSGVENMEIPVSSQASSSDQLWYLEQGWPMSGQNIDTGRSQVGITGIASTESNVYVSDYVNNRVVVYDTDLNQQTSYAVARPVSLAVASDGTLWVVSGASASTGAVILQLDASGNATGKQITDVQDPRGLAFLSNGTLLVAENGDRQQILYYSVSGTPTMVDTLGQQGGIYSGSTPGQITSDRFHSLVGVGTDSSDNIYVACNGGGAEFRKFSPSKQLLWAKYGLEFVDRGDFDPSSDGQRIYTKQEMFNMDYSQTTPGSEWSYGAYTVDPFAFPDDPRLHTSPDATWVRVVNGQKFLFLSEMYAGFLAVYRFDSAHGDIAIPTAFFGHSSQWQNNTWPATNPNSNDWIWTDTNGDGAIQSSEIVTNPNPNSYDWGIWPDSQGNIWENLSNGIIEFPLQGTNSAGSPVYTFGSAVTTPLPAPFNDAHRLYYYPESDTMYLGGYTPDQPYDGNYWGEMGKVVARYDNWSKGNRTPTYTFLAPWDTSTNPATVNEGLAVAGNYIFITEGFHPSVDVYNASDGSFVGSMFYPTNSAWVDIPFGISAYQRSTGEYDVLQEDDSNSKNILYRWNDGGAPPPPSPTPTATSVPTMTLTPTATATSTPVSGNLVMAINAGGSTSGSFVADTDVDQGNTYSDASSSIDTSDVSNPAPQDVYQTCRWNSAFTYTIPGLTAGNSYTVRLHWAELTFSGAGQRQFNVAINGASVLTNFDVYATAGYKKALVQTFNTQANGQGQIVISFTQGAADNPFVNGIEIYTA